MLRSQKRKGKKGEEKNSVSFANDKNQHGTLVSQKKSRPTYEKE